MPAVRPHWRQRQSRDWRSRWRARRRRQAGGEGLGGTRDQLQRGTGQRARNRGTQIVVVLRRVVARRPIAAISPGPMGVDGRRGIAIAVSARTGDDELAGSGLAGRDGHRGAGQQQS